MRLGKWETVRELGKGGQGVAHLAIDTEKLDIEQLMVRVQQAVAGLHAITTAEQRRQHTLGLLDDLERYLRRQDPEHCGALKVPHAEILKDEKARRRLETEVELLSRLNHPSTIGILDARPVEGWFVTPYYPGGTLASRLQRFAGKPVEALEAFRSMVEGVAALHESGVVHRDIKPENIFLSEGRLVLGDFGIAYVDDKGQTRVSEKYENVGSRDWMPGWAMGMRLDDVRPTFDLFSLGKVLWAMVSGREKMRLWYWQNEEFNLEVLFPSDDRMRWINRLLSRLVVEHERDCGWASATELLGQLDTVLSIVKRHGQVMERGRLMRCTVCGSGPYREILHEDSGGAAVSDLGLNAGPAKYRVYECRECGHLEWFRMNDRPGAWGEV